MTPISADKEAQDPSDENRDKDTVLLRDDCEVSWNRTLYFSETAGRDKPNDEDDKQSKKAAHDRMLITFQLERRNRKHGRKWTQSNAYAYTLPLKSAAYTTPSPITGDAAKPQFLFAWSAGGGSIYIQRIAPVARSSANNAPLRDAG